MPFFTENRRHPKTGYNIHRPDLMSRDQSVGSEQVISYYKPGLMTKFFEQQNDIKRVHSTTLQTLTSFKLEKEA